MGTLREETSLGHLWGGEGVRGVLAVGGHQGDRLKGQWGLGHGTGGEGGDSEGAGSGIEGAGCETVEDAAGDTRGHWGTVMGTLGAEGGAERHRLGGFWRGTGKAGLWRPGGGL